MSCTLLDFILLTSSSGTKSPIHVLPVFNKNIDMKSHITASCHCNWHSYHTCPLDGDTVRLPRCSWDWVFLRVNEWERKCKCNMCVCSSRMWFTDLESVRGLIFLMEPVWFIWGQHAAGWCHMIQTVCHTICWKPTTLSSWMPTEEDTEKVKVFWWYLTGWRFCVYLSPKRQMFIFHLAMIVVESAKQVVF